MMKNMLKYSKLVLIVGITLIGTGQACAAANEIRISSKEEGLGAIDALANSLSLGGIPHLLREHIDHAKTVSKGRFNFDNFNDELLATATRNAIRNFVYSLLKSNIEERTRSNIKLAPTGRFEDVRIKDIAERALELILRSTEYSDDMVRLVTPAPIPFGDDILAIDIHQLKTRIQKLLMAVTGALKRIPEYTQVVK